KTADVIPAALEGKLNTVELKNICFSYDKKEIFKNLNLIFSDTKNYLIKGPCGSGKTTVFKLLTGLVSPSKGTVLYNGQDQKRFTKDSICDHFSSCLQKNSMLTGTIRSIFTAVDSSVSDERIYDLLKAMRIDKLAEDNDGLDTWIGLTGLEISGGQARRLSLARTLMHEKDFILLDEPTSGLDETTGRSLITSLVSRRKGIIIISHETWFDDLFDRVIYLKE
ncbi:MAG: ATP-binding cassette domain-containing protein, partial [Succinivibrio sp.]